MEHLSYLDFDNFGNVYALYSVKHPWLRHLLYPAYVAGTRLPDNLCIWYDLTSYGADNIFW